MEDLLPPSILYRPKLGFPTPWSRWLAGPRLNVIRKLLLEPRSTDRGFFKPSAIERLFEEHRAGYRDHYDRIWRLLNLELWHRACLEKEEYRTVAVERASLRHTSNSWQHSSQIIPREFPPRPERPK